MNEGDENESGLAEGAIGEMLAHIRERLENAAAVAKAAEACATAGNPYQAVIIVLDVEQQLYEARRSSTRPV